MQGGDGVGGCREWGFGEDAAVCSVSGVVGNVACERAESIEVGEWGRRGRCEEGFVGGMDKIEEKEEQVWLEQEGRQGGEDGRKKRKKMSIPFTRGREGTNHGYQTQSSPVYVCWHGWW